MANKEIKLRIETEGFEPAENKVKKVKDALKQTTNEVISLKDQSKDFAKIFASAADFREAYAAKSTVSSKEILIGAKAISNRMEEIHSLSDKVLKEEQRINGLRQKNNQADIKSMGERTTELKKVSENYAKEEERIVKLIKKREDFAAAYIAKIRANTNLSNEQKLEEEKKFTESMANLNKAMYDAIAKNNEEWKNKANENIGKTLNGYSQLHKERTIQIAEEAKTQRQKTEAIYDAAIEEQKAIAAQIESMSKEQQLLEENVKAKEEANNKIEDLEKRKIEAIETLNDDFNRKAKENTQTQLSETTTMVDSTLAELNARTKEFKKKGGLFFDIDLTKANIQATEEQLKSFKGSLQSDMNARALYYAELEQAYANDVVMLRQTQQEKVKVLEHYSTEIAKVDKAITENADKEKGLRMKQLKQAYNEGEKAFKDYEKAEEEFKEKSKEISKGINEGFKMIKSIGLFDIDADVDKYTESLKKIDQEQAELTKKQEGYMSELKALRYKNADSSKQMTDYEIEQLKRLEKVEQEDIKKKGELEKKKAEETKKKEKAELKQKIIVAIGNVAAGVTKALASGPFIGQALAAVMSTLGAIQVGKMTAQLAKLEDGGLLRGKRHSQGGMRIEGTNIEVEGGEYVVNRESTSKNIGLVRYINSQRKELTPTDINAYFSHAAQGYEPPFSRMFESGGEIPKAEVQKENDNKALLEAIKNIKIEPKVAVTDIHRVQDEMINVSGWSGM